MTTEATYKKKIPLFIRPQLTIDEHQQLDCGNTTLTCFTSNATLTYPSQLTVRQCHQMKLSGRWPEVHVIGCIQPVLFFRRHGHSRVRMNLCCKFHYPIKYIRKHLLFKFPIANETFGFHNRKALTRTTCKGKNKVTKHSQVLIRNLRFILPNEICDQGMTHLGRFIFTVGGLPSNLLKMLEVIIYSLHRMVLV